MRPTKPANPQPDDYEPVDQPWKPKVCPYCQKEHSHPYMHICGDPECLAEAVVAPLKRWDREAIEITQATVHPCAGGCGRNVSGPWAKCAHCEDRHELEWEEANNG